MKILILSNYANGLFLFRKEVISSFIQKGAEVLISVPLDENCTKLEQLGARMIFCNLERRGMYFPYIYLLLNFSLFHL